LDRLTDSSNLNHFKFSNVITLALERMTYSFSHLLKIRKLITNKFVKGRKWTV
jgi:hypothetical protein